MALCGADGEAIFIDLLLSCSVFVAVHGSIESYYQVTGHPLHDLCLPHNSIITHAANTDAKPAWSSDATAKVRKLSEITIVRSRMFYSKPSLNRNGSVIFGLRRSHALNRESDVKSEAQDHIIMQYIFPRQFKLHNAFTSVVDRRETTQPFKDYTFRDEVATSSSRPRKSHIPRRLSGKVLNLVRKLRHNHHNCSFDQLMSHYCPVLSDLTSFSKEPSIGMKQTTCESQPSSASFQTQVLQNSVIVSAPMRMSLKYGDNADTSFLPYAVPGDQVSSFCRAGLKSLLPRHVFGAGSDGKENYSQVMLQIDKFIHMRKFETISLHELRQGLKLKAIEWIAPHNSLRNSRLANTDKQKREELLSELLYYIFDSILIPLIAANFYVTESSVHRNKLLYFRQDVWNRLCKPCLLSVRLGTLAPVRSNQAQRRIGTEQLGYSLTRLVPKDIGVRSITNLKRRSVQLINGKRILVPSVNSRLTPIFNVFNYERQHDDGIFKSDSISMQDIGEKLATFRNRVGCSKTQPLYFAKVDIRSAFDSIPQQRLLEVTADLFKHDKYLAIKHAVTKIMGDNRTNVKFIKSAYPMQTTFISDSFHETNASIRKYSVCSDTDQYQVISKPYAQKILETHIRANILRVGNKYYRQTEGIPQGSILSSLLCTFFYNHFEKTRLDFLNAECSLLLRIIDDFLLITTEKTQAIRFVEAMKKGDTDYGIMIHAEKSLVNFNIVVDNVQIPKLADSTSFPFCGFLINTETLSVSKDRCRKDNVIKNSLTVDLHGRVGRKFKRRLLSSLRIQLQSTLLGTTLNSTKRILETLLECFQETAMKLHQYHMHMSHASRPEPKLIIETIVDFINLVFHIIKQQPPGKTIILARRQVSYLAAAGILRVLTPRSASYPQVIEWLHDMKIKTEYCLNVSPKEVEHMLDASSKSVQHYTF